MVLKVPKFPARRLSVANVQQPWRRYRHAYAASRRQALPAFCFDIDGVLLQGSKVLDEGKAALRILNGENSLKQPLPFVFLTKYINE